MTSEEYRKFDFENDIFAPRLETRVVWSLMEIIVKAAGPVLLLLRLVDSNAPTPVESEGHRGVHQNINGGWGARHIGR